MYPNTLKIIFLQNIKLKLYVVIQQIKNWINHNDKIIFKKLIEIEMSVVQ